jgi:hypothetical protein
MDAGDLLTAWSAGAERLYGRSAAEPWAGTRTNLSDRERTEYAANSGTDA